MKLSFSGEAGPVHPKVIWAGAVTLSFGVVVYEIEKYSHYRFDGTETAFLTAILGIAVGYFKRAPAPKEEVRVVTVPYPVPATETKNVELTDHTAPSFVDEEDRAASVTPLPERQEHGFTAAPRAPEWGKTA